VTHRVAHARSGDYLFRMTPSTVNVRKSDRRSLTMLAALFAIAILGNVLGLVIHYGFGRHSVEPDVPIVHNLIGNASTSSQIIQ
jgi:membrane protein YqaA with SNARE-associated domain